jgi:DNA-binding LacI/PurR family transcriptional regulator
MKMSRVRLIDVAARVGVSSKSVSNVVNGTGYVGAEVRERILEAIDELGYRPNLAARQLRQGRSGLLALVIPDLREPYFAEFASRFVEAAQQRELTTLVSQTKGAHSNELAMLTGQGLPALDGIVMSPLRLTPEDVAHRRGSAPVVMIGEESQTLAGPDNHHVGIDNVAAAVAATEHLLSRGRRRIAAVGVQDDGPSATSQLRFEGYRQALAGRGIEADPSLFATVKDFNRAEGSRAVEALLNSKTDFDGLICFNGTLALGALYTLGARDVRVPDEVDVIGFDDIEEGRYTNPSFSTIDPGTDEMCTMILDIIADPVAFDERRHIVPYSIIIR